MIHRNPAGLLALALAATPACRSSDAPPATARNTAPLSRPSDAPDLDPDPGRVRVELSAQRRDDPRLSSGYNGQVPGPVLRGRVGQTLQVDFRNALDAPTTIHWHGYPVPHEMDGDGLNHGGHGHEPGAEPDLSEAGIPPGGRFTYRFPLTQPGTYWYHPHFDTARQLDGGLYGALIVEDPAEPTADDELVLLFDVPEERGLAHAALPPGRHAHGHGRLRPEWIVNGQPAPVQWRTDGGRVARVRVINAASTHYLELQWPQMRQIGGDQGLLPALERPRTVVITPGARADFEWLIGEDGFTVETLPYSLNGGPAWGEATPLIEVAVDRPAPAPAGLAWPFRGGEPSPDPGHTDLLYALAGSDRSGRWLINGAAFPNIVPDEVQRGSEPIIEVRNLSPTEHPFHIHGLYFEVLSINGRPPAYRQIADTYNIGIRERVRLKLWTDNPGVWMVHCHIIEHAEDGMLTLLRVME